VREDDLVLAVLWIFSGLLLIAGVINIILLAPSKLFTPEDAKVWRVMVYGKGAMLLLVSPILNEIVKATDSNQYALKCVQLAFIVVILVMSAYAKTHRDQKAVKLLKPDQP